jgi:sulfite reductase (NADPH) flavoprotein alpha-component
MLAEPKLKSFIELVQNATPEELIWMSGYLSGVVSKSGTAGTAAQAAPAPSAKPAVGKITIAYGTETGNSKKVASDFAARAKKKGINAKVVSLDQYRLSDLAREEYFFAVISTHGDGEPPAAAKKFYDHIHLNGFRLDKMKYGVLALGDTSYPLFCKAGEDVDEQLKKLGGQRIVNLQKCDIDYEEEANGWFDSVLDQLHQTGSSSGPALPAGITVAQPKKPAGRKIYNGTIVTSINLNDHGSNKETYHMELTADELDYQPGDALGVIPENAPDLVEEVIRLASAEREKTVSYKGETFTLYNLLHKKVNLVYLPERLIAKYATITGHDIPATRMSLTDLLRIYPLKEAGQFDTLLEILEPIAPRLYSIASSPEAHSGEVHITVARDRFWVNEEQKCGLCSDWLASLPENSSLDFYIQRNNQFRLPADDQDIIMIGPGTGIAPFRSFLAHRDATGASGKNWLFFGDQHFVTDFLYQTELLNWVDTGVLTRLNVAFSRDQKEKIYVQHKMHREGQEFYHWLNNGAFVYICGAKEPMSVDVENMILQIIEEFGGHSKEGAVEYLNAMKEEGRYLKDVY